jgi:DNA replication and repair protein RecF
LIEQRLIYTKRINELAGLAQEKISLGQEKLFVRYRTISGIKPEMSRAQVRDIYCQKLQSSFLDDLEKGTTGSGPHRDDLELSLDGEGLKPFASQGQQRSAVLALKLAELAILRQDTGEAPVLLLDDVMSELDENRRASLLENIHDAQVFVTCTDARQVVREIRREQHEQVARFTYFCVSEGQVERQAARRAGHSRQA